MPRVFAARLKLLLRAASSKTGSALSRGRILRTDDIQLLYHGGKFFQAIESLELTR